MDGSNGLELDTCMKSHEVAVGTRRYFGHERSIELIKRLKSYLDIYYSNIFFRLDPVLLKKDYSKDGTCSIEALDSLPDRETALEDIVNGSVLYGPSLLALFKIPGGSAIGSLLIFPLSVGVPGCNSNIVSNNLIDAIIGISDDCLKASKEDITRIKSELEIEFKGEETKYSPGVINKFDEHLNCFMDSKSLISVYFDTKDFCLYEINFSSALNYM
ncbi:hypothetical protein BEWA_026910 [Theileria equi strain WA]|uniref:Uncharacterized protein n=1 Tax=Theileria equi strain WA TaxID=1537102 RepID=L0AW68_THEEQ|nr:hypothetical protein BEWA_026910 [Theileria equi strain WA]AFZ79842.1 hypothetical protein BEWA_026910 [Theileria equi strain WA]|eukprot:XP_004829508.1 hypothetical protein BEWA_026910 [Theileria equi strain WA]